MIARLRAMLDRYRRTPPTLDEARMLRDLCLLAQALYALALRAHPEVHDE